MLDVEATRRNFEAWVRSPEFDDHFNSICKPPLWSFVFGGIFILTGIGIPLGIGLLIYGFVARSKRKAARRDAHLAFSHHQPILCGIVIANRQLFQQPGAVAPALLVGGFGAQDFEHAETLADTAMLLGGLYGENPAEVPEALKAAFAAVNDDTYRPNRRRSVPLPLDSAPSLLLFDAVLKGSHFDSRNIDSPYVVCMAAPGPEGNILHIPYQLAVLHPPRQQQQFIRHAAPTEPAPIVAPHSDNLEAVEKHISHHLGEPASVYHELISTTVHIDIHIVPATEQRPWISLVTSGMSDLPMTVPEGLDEWQFAELMIRVPADWQLDQESLKNEANYWPIRWLKQLARMPHELRTWLCYGHSIPNGDPASPFAPGCPFTGVVLSPPWIGGEGFETLYLIDGTPVHFWSIVPLHPSELDFKLQRGSDALFERLAAAGASDLVDLRRSPAA